MIFKLYCQILSKKVLTKLLIFTSGWKQITLPNLALIFHLPFFYFLSDDTACFCDLVICNTLIIIMCNFLTWLLNSVPQHVTSWSSLRVSKRRPRTRQFTASCCWMSARVQRVHRPLAKARVVGAVGRPRGRSSRTTPQALWGSLSADCLLANILMQVLYCRACLNALRCKPV